MIVSELIERSKSRHDPIERSDAQLQLGICYHLAFGVRPDDDMCLKQLSCAASSSRVASAIEGRLKEALGRTERGKKHERLSKSIDTINDLVTYPSESFQKRVMRIQSETADHITEVLRIQKNWWEVDAALQCIGLKATNVVHYIITHHFLTESTASFHSFIAEMDYIPDEELSECLTFACKYGKFDAAILLAKRCSFFTQKDGAEPGPLHWLIAFKPEQAVHLARLLTKGSDDSISTGGICSQYINRMIDESIFFPEHCMELFGTPLHWAARTQNLQLVKALVELGADIESRWESNTFYDSDGPKQFGLSALDVALIFHCPEIVAYLLKKGAKSPVGLLGREYTPFHLITVSTQPFSRLIIHGKNHETALEETIDVLVRAGYDLNRKGPDGVELLARAWYELDQEKYILDILLKKGALADQVRIHDGQNIATRVILDCPKRLFDAWKLEAVLHLVNDLNLPDDFGRTALHYCALTGNTNMAKVLLDSGRVMVDKRSTDCNRTALIYAGLVGAPDVIKVLLQHGADIELADSSGLTALEWAIRSRKMEAITILLNHGAQSHFKSGYTILHVGIMGVSEGSRTSIVKQLIEEHPGLMRKYLETIHAELTPLQTAAYRGDVSAVKALVAFGANCKATNLLYNRPSSHRGTALEIATSSLENLDKLEREGLVPRDFFPLKESNPSTMEDLRRGLEEIKFFLSQQ
jgi:ankyrin repeat protein